MPSPRTKEQKSEPLPTGMAKLLRQIKSIENRYKNCPKRLSRELSGLKRQVRRDYGGYLHIFRRELKEPTWRALGVPAE